MLIIIYLKTLVLFLLVKLVRSSDDYVKDLRRKCFETGRPFFCATYKITRSIDNFDYQVDGGGGLKLVKIHPENGTDNDLILPTPRFLENDSDWDKFSKFLQRKVADFAKTHVLAFEVPPGIGIVRGRSLHDIAPSQLQEKVQGPIVGSARGKLKQKKIFILSVLIIAKLIKILLLVNMIFFVLLFIKKIILVTAIVFPSILSHIKQACQLHQHKAAEITKEIPSHSSSWFGWRQDGELEAPRW